MCEKNSRVEIETTFKRVFSGKIIEPLWVSPDFCLIYCKFKVKLLFPKRREKGNTFTAAHQIVVNQNCFLPAHIERVEALENFIMQKRIMQIEGDNVVINMKSM